MCIPGDVLRPAQLVAQLSCVVRHLPPEVSLNINIASQYETHVYTITSTRPHSLLRYLLLGMTRDLRP
jgi:hypothetical protein